MNHCVKHQCQVRSSKVGAKGFHYPGTSSSIMRVKAGTKVELLSFLVDREFCDWQAILIDNADVDGSPVEDGKSVYWIMRKNIM